MGNEPEILATSNRCPKCKGCDFLIIESVLCSTTFDVRDGVFDRGHGYHEPGRVIGTDCKCTDCGHFWKPRNRLQIDEYVDDALTQEERSE